MNAENETPSASEISEIIGTRLLALRGARGLSRDALQKETDIHWDVIRRVESEGRDVSLKELFTLCEAMNESPLNIISAEYAMSV